MDGDQHQQQRRLMMPAFHKKQIVNYHHDMIDQTQRQLDRWEVGHDFDLLREMLQRYRLAVRPNVKLSVDFTMRAKPPMPVRIFAQDRQFKCTPVRGPIQDMVERI